jgi:hypothetical protein
MTREEAKSLKEGDVLFQVNPYVDRELPKYTFIRLNKSNHNKMFVSGPWGKMGGSVRIEGFITLKYFISDGNILLHSKEWR